MLYCLIIHKAIHFGKNSTQKQFLHANNPNVNGTQMSKFDFVFYVADKVQVIFMHEAPTMEQIE